MAMDPFDASWINKNNRLFANKNLKYILLNNNSHDLLVVKNIANQSILRKLSKSFGFEKFLLPQKYCQLKKI